MRLSSLHISEWKNLKDFSIDLKRGILYFGIRRSQLYRQV